MLGSLAGATVSLIDTLVSVGSVDELSFVSVSSESSSAGRLSTFSRLNLYSNSSGRQLSAPSCSSVLSLETAASDEA